ncbi:MAG: tRNA dihydrouridine(20/20a) synthase DusA [Cyanobacteria bacterium P01_F01_bin.13]
MLTVPPRQRLHPLSVAPMMDRTDRHFRYFMRQITRKTLLYTEMITAQAILHGDRKKLLGFDLAEKPLSLQIGGDNPQLLAKCATIAEEMGYDEVNLNVGCPSNRVQSGNFGACLMAQPELVADCVAAMQTVVKIPVTVKHRIGIDECDRYEDMVKFITTVATTGCQRFTVHARKAWLQGLSPKDNRTIPPLRYEDIYRLKREHPQLWIEINGGIKTLEQASAHLPQVDAVMIGRAAYDTPYMFAWADRDIYAADMPFTRHQVVEAMLPYIARWTEQGTKLHSITRHMLQLFHGQPGSRAWKRHLTDNSCRPDAGVDTVKAALAQVPASACDVYTTAPLSM